MVAASSWLDGTTAALRPPPRLTLSEWADLHFRLSSGDAEAGQWHTRPYQRAIMDAITDPAVERVSVQKSARIGWTQIMNAAIAYYMTQDPCTILVVQPTVDLAEIYSREMIAPMLREVPALAHLVRGAAVKTNGRTLLHKTYPGGVLSMVGANSGSGFAMISRRVVAFDEVDRYPASAGDEGDPILLGEKRAATYWNRKIIAGSTPLVEGTSRIAEMAEAGDQRRRYLPCPHCGHFDFLTPRERPDGRGHVMRWTPDHPSDAVFQCSKNGCVIEEKHKKSMDEEGEWRADAPFLRHASFFIWTAYSTSPNATWAQIAAEYDAAKKLGSEKLKTVINTTFGETWIERGEAPNWEGLYGRREGYKVGTVPERAIALTCGVDVQKIRLVYEVVAWAANRESWSVEIGELLGDTSLEATEPGSPWAKLDALLARSFPGVADQQWLIMCLAVDSGAFTQSVYSWARRPGRSARVLAVKGVPGARTMIGSTTAVDVTVGGKRIQRGYRMWPVGVDVIKAELYGNLGLQLADDGTAPPGYCHFPDAHDREFFRQLTAEHLVTSVNKRTGRSTREWRPLPNRENHWLDARVYARAAVAVLGIDRLAAAAAARPPAPVSPAGPAPAAAAEPAPHAPAGEPRAAARRSSFWAGRRSR
jgi:phage terminase large subunit GpA-like protein